MFHTTGEREKEKDKHKNKHTTDLSPLISLKESPCGIIETPFPKVTEGLRGSEMLKTSTDGIERPPESRSKSRSPVTTHCREDDEILLTALELVYGGDPKQTPSSFACRWAERLEHLGVHALRDDHAAHPLQQPHLRHVGRHHANLRDLQLPLEEGVLRRRLALRALMK